ncbi:hypothetical protein CTI12_AA483350 [Artemisia annua]|uniref:Retrotransposon Copia-like N-terminal domain-containing protein n=1 Tax=Artemisia annua TaxID=35608 RepID=A0A2U1LJQ2_ARTAN|nr:hypothetical protein CTI12_AA483350 [Artemisia annua]
MAIPNHSSQNDVASGSNTQNSSNSIHDPLYISNSDHPGMVLTNTPFNGSNFLGWSRTIKMALGAKLKLGFITGSTPRPAVTDENHQKWVRCDYMVTCWILNSMTAELTEAFLYAQSAAELWKEINERYGQSNGPLIYHLQRELNNVSQGSLTIAAYFNKLKRCWDELHNLNGVPTCSCGKMQECSCGLVEKFAEIENRSKLVQFLMKLNEEYESVRNQVLAMDPLPNVNKAYYIVQQVEKQKQVTNHMPEPVAFFANVNQFKNGRRDTRNIKLASRETKISASLDTNSLPAPECYQRVRISLHKREGLDAHTPSWPTSKSIATCSKLWAGTRFATTTAM